jgi:hypothetical protein
MRAAGNNKKDPKAAFRFVTALSAVSTEMKLTRRDEAISGRGIAGLPC